jgi:hypothetical protein
VPQEDGGKSGAQEHINEHIVKLEKKAQQQAALFGGRQGVGAV